jgi:hypothetical protein
MQLATTAQSHLSLLHVFLPFPVFSVFSVVQSSLLSSQSIKRLNHGEHGEKLLLIGLRRGGKIDFSYSILLPLLRLSAFVRVFFVIALLL